MTHHVLRYLFASIHTYDRGYLRGCVRERNTYMYITWMPCKEKATMQILA